MYKRQLKSGLEGLGIAIYDNIKGPLRSVTQTATEMVGSLSDALTNGGFSAFVAQLGNVLGQAVTMIAVSYTHLATRTKKTE